MQLRDIDHIQPRQTDLETTREREREREREIKHWQLALCTDLVGDGASAKAALTGDTAAVVTLGINLCILLCAFIMCFYI